MEHVFVSNGITQLVLIPKSELDRLLLERIIGDGPVEVEFIRQPVGILGKSVKDGVIIRRKQNNIDASETEELYRVQADEVYLEKSR